MTGLFDYPKSAAFGRVLPKTKIYEHAGANTALKDLFVREVDQIVWRYKLAPETINLSATKSVAEIQVFDISLKTGKLDEAILRAIDKAIPFPLIFELTHGGRRKAIAAFKRPAQNHQGKADISKWVTSEYFATAWIADTAAKSPMPVALNLGTLYEELLGAILSMQDGSQMLSCGLVETSQAEIEYPPLAGTMAERVERMEAIRAKTGEIARIKVRLMREKQFNKRVTINAELRAAVREHSALVGGHDGKTD